MLAQHGVISREQALRCGMSRHEITSEVGRGTWTPVMRGVYRGTVIGRTHEAIMTVAWLAAPAAAAFSHHTAARFHDLGVRPESPYVWITVPHGRSRLRVPYVRVGQSRALAGHTVRRGQWRFTTVARTLVDMGEHLTARQLERVVYAAVQAEKVTVEQVRQAWRAVSRRPGRNAITQVLERYDASYDSGLESDAGRIFERSGIRLERQHRVSVGDRIVRRFDFADPDLKIGVEIDGVAYHSSLAAQQRDRAKDRRLAALGWVTIRFTTADVRRDPGGMVRTIKQLRERRLAEEQAGRRRADPGAR